MNDSKLGYRVTEAAKAIGIGVSKLKEEMYQGRIKYIKVRNAGGDTAVGLGRTAEAGAGPANRRDSTAVGEGVSGCRLLNY